MLVKKEMLKIPPLGCPSYKGSQGCEILGISQVFELPKSGKLLVIDFYEKANKELVLRFFCDGKNSTMCKEWPAITWFTKLPDKILRYRNIHNSDEHGKLAQEFLGSHYFNLHILVDNFIREKNWERAVRANESKYGKLVEHIAMFPKYPKGLEKYCKQYVFDRSYIFISKIIKGKRNALCGRCRKKFKVDRSVRSGTSGTCPKCGTAVTYRGEWTNYYTTDKANICIAHRVDGQLLIRWTTVKRTYPGEPKPCYSFEDYYYNLTLNVGQKQINYSYKWMPTIYYQGYSWIRKKNGDENYEVSHVYAENLADVFGEAYGNVNLVSGLRNAGSIPFLQLLQNLREIPITEYLFKLGLTQLASKTHVRDLRGSSFSEVLGVPNELKPLYRKYNLTWNEHCVIQEANSWVSETNFIKFREFGFKYERGDLDSIRSALEHMSFDRFVNYFSGQMEIQEAQKSSRYENRYERKVRLFVWYRDYIGMSETLGVDLSRKSVRYPKCIKSAHDTIVERYNKIKHKHEDENMKQAAKILYAGISEFTNGVFCVVLPMGRSDLLREGQSLNHCVGQDGYYTRHMEGTKMIFFVRRVEAPDKPYFTLEVDMGARKLLQLYGFGDSSATHEVRKFAQEFIRRMKPAERKAS